nr:MAG TPA: hypothetical protein [Caudoviricetes sp.]
MPRAGSPTGNPRNGGRFDSTCSRQPVFNAWRPTP